MPSERKIVATRHHWIVLFKLPNRWAGIAFVLLVLWAWVEPVMVVVVLVLLLAVIFVRVQTWQAEQIIVTDRRIVRVRGVPETTSTEAFLRLDRVSGARLVQTVPGKIAGYGTIELEAPGDHPDVRKLVKIPDPERFYDRLRSIVFDEHNRPDPDELSDPGPVAIGQAVDGDNLTERLPRLPPQ